MIITSEVRRVFVPVNITLSTEVEVATLLGALIAYGTASVYAENALKAIGLGDYYSGNVRKGARNISQAIATATGIEGLDTLVEAYLSSNKFASSKASQAGSKVIGTADDLAPGYEPTTFESEAAENDSNGSGFFEDESEELDEEYFG